MMLTTWKILKTFGNLSLADLLQHSQEPECPCNVMPVTPNSLRLINWSKYDALFVVPQTSEIPRPWLPLQKETDHSLPVEMFLVQGYLLCSKSKLLKTGVQFLCAFSVLGDVPVILVYNCRFPFSSSKYSFLQTLHSPGRSQLWRRASGLWKAFSWNNPVMCHLRGKNVVTWVNICTT